MDSVEQNSVSRELKELEILELGPEGDGIASLEGRRVVVPFSLPGERVLAEIQSREISSRSRGPLIGRAEKIISASPLRREAACPLFGQCGGCQWLHVSEEFQRSEKAREFRAALLASGVLGEAGPLPEGKFGGIEAVSPFWGYRRRTTLHVSGGRLGFSRRKSHEVLPVQKCLLLQEDLNGVLLRLSEAMESRGKSAGRLIPRGCTDVALESDASGRVAAAFFFASKPSGEAVRQSAEIVRRMGLAGGVVSWTALGGAQTSEIIGRPLLPTDAPMAEGSVLFGRPDLFCQAHLRAGEVLTAAVMPFIPPGSRLLELYGGSGMFTLAASFRAAAVTSIEISAPALSLTRKSASHAGIQNIRCIAGDALKKAGDLARSGERFDAVLLDPPRAGAKGIAEAVSSVGARRVIYVSCNPKTLAVDASVLAAAGYVPTWARGFDLFPQTRHLEAVMVFERGD